MRMTQTPDSIRALLKSLAEADGVSLKNLSEKAGKNHAYLQQFVTRGTPRTLPEDVREVIAAELGVPATTFKVGAHATSPRLGAQDIHVGGEEYLPVPIYDIRASAGPGSIAEDGSPIAHQVFREQWLSALTRAPVDSLAVIEVSGDSMEPTLANRDTILVDRSIERVREDGIYVLFFDEALLVKRCSRDLADGSVFVVSDNPRYKEQRLTEADQLQVIGRVIWIGRALG